MSPTVIFFVYLLISLVDLGWGSFLSSLNYRSVSRHGGEVPKALRKSVGRQEAAKSAEYSKAKMRLGFIEAPITTFLILAATATGLFGLLDSCIAQRISAPYWRGVLFLAAVLVASAALSSPFELYSTFALEKRFGFNTTSLKTWLLDALKSALISAALGLPLLYLLYAFIDGTGPLWWIWAAAIFSVLDIGLSLVYPLLIAPLFNKFTPLPEGSLKSLIQAFADRVGFKVSGVFEMDGSKRSRHSNAYFTGIGKAKRIVLYDTLIAQMSEEEIVAVLAHEVGHEKGKHVLKMTAVSVLLSFVSFWILDLLMTWPELYPAFGFAESSKHAILLILGLVSGPATFFLTPLFSLWSRKHEYEADSFAAREGGRSPQEAAAALSSSLIKLNRENASNLWPHPLYSAWYYSHPSLTERLAAIERGTNMKS
jgi:Zn-dependent protease with chaperone function